MKNFFQADLGHLGPSRWAPPCPASPWLFRRVQWWNWSRPSKSGLGLHPEQFGMPHMLVQNCVNLKPPKSALWFLLYGPQPRIFIVFQQYRWSQLIDFHRFTRSRERMRHHFRYGSSPPNQLSITKTESLWNWTWWLRKYLPQSRLIEGETPGSPSGSQSKM